MQLRDWAWFGFATVVVAVALRYLVPGRFGLAFRWGGVVRGIPINLLAFWLVLAVAGIVILGKMIGAHK